MLNLALWILWQASRCTAQEHEPAPCFSTSQKILDKEQLWITLQPPKHCECWENRQTRGLTSVFREVRLSRTKKTMTKCRGRVRQCQWFPQAPTMNTRLADNRTFFAYVVAAFVSHLCPWKPVTQGKTSWVDSECADCPGFSGPACCSCPGFHLRLGASDCSPRLFCFVGPWTFAWICCPQPLPPM